METCGQLRPDSFQATFLRQERGMECCPWSTQCQETKGRYQKGRCVDAASDKRSNGKEQRCCQRGTENHSKRKGGLTDRGGLGLLLTRDDDLGDPGPGWSEEPRKH